MTTMTMTKRSWNTKCLTLNYFNIVIAFPMVFVNYLARGVCNNGCQRYSYLHIVSSRISQINPHPCLALCSHVRNLLVLARYCASITRLRLSEYSKYSRMISMLTITLGIRKLTAQSICKRFSTQR
jgi:hypothetical protein